MLHEEEDSEEHFQAIPPYPCVRHIQLYANAEGVDADDQSRKRCQESLVDPKSPILNVFCEILGGHHEVFRNDGDGRILRASLSNVIKSFCNFASEAVLKVLSRDNELIAHEGE